MKNIVIIGSPRSGKTTLAKEIFKRNNEYSLISSDPLRFAFMEVMPELDINDKGGVGTLTRYPYFLKTFIERSNFKHSTYYILEGDFSNYEQAKELFYNDDTLLVFVGKTMLSREELLKGIRNNDINPHDWTLRFSDDELIKQCDDFINKSIDYKEKCLRDGLLFIDTSYNHNDVISEYADRIVNGEFD